MLHYCIILIFLDFTFTALLQQESNVEFCRDVNLLFQIFASLMNLYFSSKEGASSCHYYGGPSFRVSW